MRLGVFFSYSGAKFALDMDLILEAERLGYDYIDAQENINHFMSQQGRTPTKEELESLIPDERIREKFLNLSREPPK